MGIKKKRIKLALKRARREASSNPKIEAENSVILEELKKETLIEPEVEPTNAVQSEVEPTNAVQSEVEPEKKETPKKKSPQNRPKMCLRLEWGATLGLALQKMHLFEDLPKIFQK